MKYTEGLFFSILTWLTLALASGSASAQIVISEVFEPNGGTAKFVELHNMGGSTVDLAAGDYELWRYSNGGASPTAIDLTGSIAPGGFYVVGDAAVDTLFGGGTLDQTTSSVNHNGNDTYELRNNASTTADLVDAFAGDNNLNSSTFAANVTAFRVEMALENNGDWGSTTQPSDGNTSTSGFWVVFDISSGNANAVATATPGMGGGGMGQEVPVTLESFSIE